MSHVLPGYPRLTLWYIRGSKEAVAEVVTEADFMATFGSKFNPLEMFLVDSCGDGGGSLYNGLRPLWMATFGPEIGSAHPSSNPGNQPPTCLCSCTQAQEHMAALWSSNWLSDRSLLVC